MCNHNALVLHLTTSYTVFLLSSLLLIGSGTVPIPDISAILLVSRSITISIFSVATVCYTQRYIIFKYFLMPYMGINKTSRENGIYLEG